ncbi:MAG: peptide chain release factor 1 [Thermaerobacter sp.]|jgi:peptide chain release factor 1|nr:peptide chain release factor 1 [Thermaerobacter sp.]
MIDQLAELERRYAELSERLADPALLGDQQAWRSLRKEHSRLEPVVECYRELEAVRRARRENARLSEEEAEPEFHRLVEEEEQELARREEDLAARLRKLLLPRDPRDDKDVILEIRAGVGGEEAALFAADLLRMYTRYAERHGWRTEILASSPTDIGGFKEVILGIAGEGVYSRLKFESGTHRVQRVPSTESSGRIHTSAATVAVMAEAEEVEVDIRPEDLRVDTFRSGGAGGQHVNKTESAVRITHLPTGLVVSCQDEKSQHKNRERAMRVLRARLWDRYEEARRSEQARARRDQVGTGDRSERIRTYNFPQGRVTDHRIGMTLHRIEAVLDGDLDELVDALAMSADQARLAAQGGS